MAMDTFRQQDRAFYERELADFLPDRIFDAHTHLWRSECSGWPVPGNREAVGYELYCELSAMLHPNRSVSALFIPYAHPSLPDSLETANAWVADQVVRGPGCRGSFFVSPGDDPDWVRQEVRRLGLHGLKCYHTFAHKNPTWDADIPDYLPEPLVRIAHEEGWFITLHVVKEQGVADPVNLHWIHHYCSKYPNIRLILAHSARGFQPAHNLTGLPKLKGLGNLYFDTSANCDPLAHQAIMRIIGVDRMMYGTDLPVSHHRGRSVCVSDTFIWISEDSPVWQATHAVVKPVLVGLEHLRSLKWACWSERLTDSEVEAIFYRNAAYVFNL